MASLLPCSLLILSGLEALGAEVPFPAQTLIESNNDGGYRDAFQADLDGDGDLDVLTAEYSGTLAWHENDLGDASSWTRREIAGSATTIFTVWAADLDRDGDMDAIAGERDDVIAWYPNTGNGVFGTRQVVTRSAATAVGLFVTDLDRDGDPDILSATITDDTIAWYANDGNGIFGPFESKLTVPTYSGAYELGQSVALSDRTLVVGGAGLAGVAHVFERGDATGPWTRVATLMASDGVSGDEFGFSVSLSGDTIVVGAPGDASDVGSAYVFVQPTGGWAGDLNESTKLLASNAASNDRFGQSVSVSGEAVVVGAPCTFACGTSSGKAYVYVKPFAGWSGSTTEDAQLIVLSDAIDDRFGASVSISGGAVVAGAPDADVFGTNSGMAYIFLEPVGGWSGSIGHSARLSASDPAIFDIFGLAVSISGENVVVGAPADDDGGLQSGSAYVFQKPAGGWSGDLTENAKLTASDASANTSFGQAVAIHGERIAVGALGWDESLTVSNTGAAYLFEPASSGIWFGPVTEIERFNASDAGEDDFLGASVAVSDTTLAAGARYDDEVSVSAGAAYAFDPAQRIIAVGIDGARSVFAADLDGDADLDVLSTSALDGVVGWYEHDGVGGFAARQTIDSALTYARSAFAGDLDGDGDPDVMAIGNDEVVWYENPGWTARTIEAVTVIGRSISAADIDDDGDLDVLAAMEIGGTVSWYDNDGASPPSFTKRIVPGGGDETQVVRAADMDRDGDLDLLYATLDKGPCLFACDTRAATVSSNASSHGSVAFAPAQNIWTSPAQPDDEETHSILGADVDGDGDKDIVSIARFGIGNGTSVAWHVNALDVGSPWVRSTIDTPAANPRTLEVADLDGDSDPDVIVGFDAIDTVGWYDNEHGDGTGWGALQPISTLADGVTSLATGDFDRDGDEDLVVGEPGLLSSEGSSDSGDVYWYENADGDGTIWTRRWVRGTGMADTFALVTVDLDRDGDLDVLSGVSFEDNGQPPFPFVTDSIEWYENPGNPGEIAISWNVHSISFGERAGVRSLSVADLDGDGDPDVIAFQHWSGDDEVTWFENTAGTGLSWTLHVLGDVASGFHDAPERILAAVDLDEDGDLDVVAGADGPLFWFENAAGDASSWARHQVSANTRYQSLVVADVDRDGDDDVVSSSPLSDTIDWYENRGGQFALNTLDAAPTIIWEGERNVVFAIDVTHLGRPGESPLEIASVELRFEDPFGSPLSTSEVTDLIANIQVWSDDGTNTFDPASDSLLIEIGSLSLAVDGSISIPVPDGIPENELGPGASARVFVALTATATGSAGSPNQFVVTHVTESSTQAEDADHDTPLTMEYTPDLNSKLITIPEAGSVPMLIAGVAFVLMIGRGRALRSLEDSRG